MTKKRKIVLMSVFLCVASIMLVMSLVFNVRKLEVIIKGTNAAQTAAKEAVIKNSNIKKGSHIFFVNKTKAKNNIEKKMPRYKVESLVSKFPDKISITISVREDLLFIKQIVNQASGETTNYFVLDKELKVLETKKNALSNPANSTKTIDLKGINVPGGTEAGDFLTNKNLQNFIKYMSAYPQVLNFAQVFKDLEVKEKGNAYILNMRDSYYDCQVEFKNIKKIDDMVHNFMRFYATVKEANTNLDNRKILIDGNIEGVFNEAKS